MADTLNSMTTVPSDQAKEKIPPTEEVASQKANPSLPSSAYVCPISARVVTEDIEIKNWNKWDRLRKTTDSISISDMTAISFGVNPSATNKLKHTTSPDKNKYDARLKEIFGMADSKCIEIKNGYASPLNWNDVSRIKISFSQFMEYVSKHNLSLHASLVALELNVRQLDLKNVIPEPPEVHISEANDAVLDLNQDEISDVVIDLKKHEISDSVVDPNKDEQKEVKSQRDSVVAVKNIEITLGALLIYLGQAIRNKTIPKNLLINNKLNQTEIKKQLKIIIGQYLDDGELPGNKTGHGDRIIRDRISRALEHFDESAYSSLLYEEDGQEKIDDAK